MAYVSNFSFLASIFLFNIINIPFVTNSLSSCNGACNDLNDCAGQLICINGKCNDDPNVGTHVCSGRTTPSLPRCSPPVSSSTQALLTLNDFSEGGDGGGPSECDDSYHSNVERVTALSTGWYNKGSRCGKMIRIMARNEKSVTAKVVDECDSVNGCDAEHAGQPPCRNNIVDGSVAVWNALGLDTNVGVEQITWSMA